MKNFYKIGLCRDLITMILYASDYMADAQDDDYSGGLESPEPQDGDSVDFNSPTSPELQACHLYTKIQLHYA